MTRQSFTCVDRSTDTIPESGHLKDYSEFVEWEAHTPKVNFRMGITSKKLCGPYFFNENTVTTAVYQRMLSEFLIPQLIDDGTKDTVVFQQDGALMPLCSSCQKLFK